MNYAEFQVPGLSDPRLALHAASPLPAWLWSADGTRILWTNLAGAHVFGAVDGAELAPRNFGGFGAAPGMLATCGCSRLDFPDGSHGVLIVATELTGRWMPRAAPAKKTAPPSSEAALLA